MSSTTAHRAEPWQNPKIIRTIRHAFPHPQRSLCTSPPRPRASCIQHPHERLRLRILRTSDGRSTPSPQVRRVYTLATVAPYDDATRLQIKAILSKPDLPHTHTSSVCMSVHAPVLANRAFLVDIAAAYPQSVVLWYEGSLICALLSRSRPRVPVAVPPELYCGVQLAPNNASPSALTTVAL